MGLEYCEGHGGRISNIKYFPSDSIVPPFKLAIRLKFFRDPAMPSRDSSLKRSSSPSLQNRLAPKQHRLQRHRTDSQFFRFRPTQQNLDPVLFHRLADIFQELFPVPLAPIYIHYNPYPCFRDSSRDRKHPEILFLTAAPFKNYLFVSSKNIFFCFSCAFLTA